MAAHISKWITRKHTPASHSPRFGLSKKLFAKPDCRHENQNSEEKAAQRISCTPRNQFGNWGSPISQQTSSEKSISREEAIRSVSFQPATTLHSNCIKLRVFQRKNQFMRSIILPTSGVTIPSPMYFVLITASNSEARPAARGQWVPF